MKTWKEIVEFEDADILGNGDIAKSSRCGLFMWLVSEQNVEQGSSFPNREI